MTWLVDNALWFAPLTVGLAVFLAVMALLLPRESARHVTAARNQQPPTLAERLAR